MPMNSIQPTGPNTPSSSALPAAERNKAASSKGEAPESRPQPEDTVELSFPPIPQPEDVIIGLPPEGERRLRAPKKESDSTVDPVSGSSEGGSATDQHGQQSGQQQKKGSSRGPGENLDVRG